MIVEDSKNKLIDLLKFIGLIYVVFACLVIIVKCIFAYINDEIVFDTFNLYFRSFFFAFPEGDLGYLYVNFEKILFFSVLLILFFSIFFYLIIDYNFVNSLIVLISSLVIVIFVSRRFPLCILEGLMGSSIVYFVSISRINSLLSKNVNVLIKIVKLLLVLILIFASIFMFI